MPVAEKLRQRAGRKRKHKPASPEAERVGKAVTEARGERSLEEIAKEIPISHQALSKIESGRSNPEDPRTKRTLRRLAEVLNNAFGLGWLRPYVQPLQSAAPSKIRGSRNLQLTPLLPTAEQRGAPLVGRIAAGKPIEEIHDSDIRELPFPRRWQRAGFEIYALKVEGNSMKEDSILDGDIVFIRNNKTPNNGRVVVAHVNGGATLKRWFVSRNKVTLRPANKDMPEEEISRRSVTLGRKEIECFGEMVGLLREV